MASWVLCAFKFFHCKLIISRIPSAGFHQALITVLASRKGFSVFCAGHLGALLTGNSLELNSQLEVFGQSKK